MSEVRKRFPLSWPLGWPRTKTRTRAQFGKVTRNERGYAGKARVSAYDGAQRIADELLRLGVKEDDFLISTNLQTRLDGFPRSDGAEPSDPGAAVYWQDKNGQPHCMAIDHYSRCADNLAAIAATLEALRAVQRHGGGAILDRTIEGLRPALPETTSRPWRVILEFKQDEAVTLDGVEARFRDLARRHHSDHHGGNDEHMIALNRARAEARAALEDAT